MCWPSCKGGAYLAVSVFVYRAIMVIITMISSSISQYKSTYLPLTVMEELLLQLVYFIPLFTSSCFIMIGIESNSFNYMFYSTLWLGTTLFFRYVGELTFIFAQGWHAYKLKLPQIYLHLSVDVILLIVLLLYARSRLRLKAKERVWKDSKDIYQEEGEGEGLIHNDLKGDTLLVAPVGVKNVNVQNPGISGINAGDEESLTYYHYPPITRIDPERGRKPLPLLPRGGLDEDGNELDNISLPPPPVPLAGPEEE